MDFILPKRPQNSNKGSFGKVLNIAGSPNYTGAAYLSSIAALKSGCGYVALAGYQSVLNVVASISPDIVLIPINQAKDVLKKYDVISIGSGFSTDAAAILIFKSLMSVIATLDIPVVIDADGLNILSKFSKMDLPEKLILTPHPKEASRLLKLPLNEVLQDLEKSAIAISEKYNCVTVLKSHNTVIASKKSSIYINRTGNSALAKAGTGDVLCGMIAGFLAQKMKLFESAKLAVYLHGLAGELASKDLSEYSVLASDLLNYIPLAIRDLT